MNLLENNIVRVGLALVVGLAVIIYFNPPSTPCTAQIEVYKEATSPLRKPLSKAIVNCRDHPEPGGCVEFFDLVSRFQTKLNEVTHQCKPELASDPGTHDWINWSMELFTRIAWGSRPPSSYLYRNGWLELTQVVEFCRLRGHLETIYGKEAWAQFANGILTDLPGSSELSSQGVNEAWNRSLLSDPCQYPP